MFKTVINHFIYEHALDAMFDNIHKNFMCINANLQMVSGKQFPYIKCNWVEYEIIIRNVKIESVNHIGMLGTYIELSSTEPIEIINYPDYNDCIVDKTQIDHVFNTCLTPCNDCYLTNMFYIKETIVIGQSSIREIRV